MSLSRSSIFNRAPKEDQIGSAISRLPVECGTGGRTKFNRTTRHLNKTHWIEGPKGAKRIHGFQSGDLAIAVVTTGKKRGTYRGRVAVRASGSFAILGKVDGINYRFFHRIHQSDGYSYSKGEWAFPPVV